LKKRIAIFGWGVLAIEIAQFLLIEKQSQCDIIFACPNDTNEKRNEWQPSFEEFAKQANLKLVKPAEISNLADNNSINEQNLDFLFSLQYNKILKKEIIDTPRHGSINLHFSPLPKYRGVAAPTWALINGEKEFGVTLHYMDREVDQGEIINQTTFNIEEVENARMLYDICTTQAITLFKNSVDDIFDLTNKRMPQDPLKATHYPRKALDFSNNKICWNTSTRSLTNWIKALIFPPFQLPKFLFEGNEFEVIAVEPDYTEKQDSEYPGTIVFRKGNIFKFATNDAYIFVTVK